jgi:hypothetical protein
MRPLRLFLIPIALVACLAHVHAAPSKPRPFIAYLCASGGQAGSTFRMIAGGQNLRGSKQVIVSGEGVSAEVIRFGRVSTSLRTEVRRELGQRLRRLVAAKIAELTGKPKRRQPARKRPTKQKKAKAKGDKAKTPEKPVVLPDHPLLKNMEKLSLKELRKVAYEFLDPSHRSQTSAQIQEIAEIEITIAADATPGDREFRLRSRLGLSNPVLFQIGRLPEFSEQEPNDFETSRQETLDVPRVINGQVGFKDFDRFRFRAKKGQKLVIDAQARRLVPYLADAVPGWFQATLAIFDEKGNEITFGDDYRFDPDPVLFFDVPQDGVYVLEIRDAIDRGREDFVYRITIAERPFITSVFPLGGRTGSLTSAAVTGWNLPWDYVLLDTAPGVERFRNSSFSSAGLRTNSIPFVVDDILECNETEPNDAMEMAQPIELPRIVNGRISSVDDVDVFRIEGRAGDDIVAEVCARLLDSPLDSLLRLTDASGRVLAWNDDYPDRTAGLITHHADSYVRAKLPADGIYYVRLSDTQNHGGEAYAYRLRIGPPRPDFTLIVTPSALNVPAGSTIPITVHAVRRDGFDGDIDLALQNTPRGFVLSGARIPAGRDRIRLTLSAPMKALKDPIRIKLLGTALIANRTVRRTAMPAEDQMQAFLNRHLVAASALLVDVTNAWPRMPPMRLVTGGSVYIPTGGTAEVLVRGPKYPTNVKIDLQLGDAPDGISLREWRLDNGSVALVLAADKEKAKVGWADNLIVEVYADFPVGGKASKKGKARPRKGGKKKAKPGTATGPDGKAKPKAPPRTRRVYMGVLPAIPFVISP